MGDGLLRWEVGEIAARIFQLYYGQYQRTSLHLLRGHPIFSREYLGGSGGGGAQDSVLANLRLRFLARFLIVCLVLGRRDMAAKLVGSLRSRRWWMSARKASRSVSIGKNGILFFFF